MPGARDRRSPPCSSILEVSWAWHRTPQLFEWEPNKRQATRAQAEDFLAATSRPDDLLFGYEPFFLGAWERNHVVPGRRPAARRCGARAPARSSGSRSRSAAASGSSMRASGTTSSPRLEMENRDPGPPGLFETRVFGPFLVLRTREPVEDRDAYLAAAARVMLVGPVARDRRRRRQHADDRAGRPQPPRLRAVGAPSLGHLAIAGRALERAEAGRRLAPSPAAAATARGGRGRGSDQPPDHERAHLAARLSSRRAFVASPISADPPPPPERIPCEDRRRCRSAASAISSST